MALRFQKVDPEGREALLKRDAQVSKMPPKVRARPAVQAKNEKLIAKHVHDHHPPK